MISMPEAPSIPSMPETATTGFGDIGRQAATIDRMEVEL